MVERSYAAFNVEFEILFESFVNNFLQVHFLHTNMQKYVATKYTSFIAENGWTSINYIEYWIWGLFESFLHSFSWAHILHTNMEKVFGSKHSSLIA